MIAAAHRHAREQLRDERLDDGAEEHEVAAPELVGQADETRQRARRLHHGKAAVAAESVLALDDEIDEINRLVQADLVETMQSRPEISQQSLNAIIVSRNLERSADHATNIAEDVIFWVRGADVRHHMHESESKPA